MVSFFPVIDDDPDCACFVAWTTTPWTLPSNLALCVNAGIVYVKVRNKFDGKVYDGCRSTSVGASSRKGLRNPRMSMRTRFCPSV
ncbi:hypothetical protein ACP275_11G026700 [Erythranthe tilingii]